MRKVEIKVKEKMCVESWGVRNKTNWSERHK